MNIDSIQNGVVIDHITAGCGMRLYGLLGLDGLDVPVAMITNVVSAITHGISGFASLYLLIADAAPLKKQDIPFTLGILTGFAAVAYGVNHLIDYNYMFLMAGDGTPYDILYNLVGGSPVWYPLLVVVLFYVYIAAFYGVRHFLRCKSAKNVKNCATV